MEHFISQRFSIWNSFSDTLWKRHTEGRDKAYWSLCTFHQSLQANFILRMYTFLAHVIVFQLYTFLFICSFRYGHDLHRNLWFFQTKPRKSCLICVFSMQRKLFFSFSGTLRTSSNRMYVESLNIWCWLNHVPTEEGKARKEMMKIK